MSDANNKVLDRVKKMLALGNCMGTTEHERDTAMKQAYKLITKYNLDPNALKEEADTAGPRGDFKQAGWSMLWARQASHLIAELFFCEYYYSGKINATKCYHQFVGKEGNATTAMHITDHIVSSILKEGRARFGDNLCAGTRSFALGCVDRLHVRIAALKREAATEYSAPSSTQSNGAAGTAQGSSVQGSTAGTALALANVYQSEKEANEALLPKLKINKAQGKAAEASPYFAGREFGDKLSLNIQVGGSSTTKLR